MTTEPTLYSDKRGVRITPTRATFGKTAYAMADITSATRGEDPPRRAPGITLAILSLVVLPACIAFGSTEGIVISIMVLLAGIIIAITAKPTYHVRITGASGEVNATSSEDKRYVDNIVTALNEAITRHN
jgi:hypothetical protein